MRLNLIGALFFLVVSVPGLALADEKPARHVEKAGGYSFVPPAGWTLRELPGFKYKLAAGPPADGFAPNVNVVDEAFKGSLRDYVAGNKKTLARVFKSLKELGETELKTNAGVPCIRMVFERDFEGKLLRQSAYFLELTPGKKLVVTCTALADGGEKLDALFEKCVKTFRVENP